VIPVVVLVLGSAAVLLGLYLCSPSLPVVLALPASFMVFRLGAAGGGNNLSLSDAVLIVSTLAALPLLRWSEARHLKRLLALVAVYQASTLFSVVDHLNRYDVVEWFHQLLLVAGSAVVGSVIVERGRARQALTSFLLIAGALSLVTFVDFGLHGFHALASLPGGFQKNPLGILFAAAVLIAQFKPDWAGLSGVWVQVVKYLCLLGVVACQSRQSMIALVITIGIVYLRGRGLARRSKVLLAALVPVGAVAYVTTLGQVHSNSSQNSVAVREAWYRQALALWRHYPYFGVGERFWYTGLYGIIVQPPNAEVSMLATGGVVGLLGFLVLVIGALVLCWRLPPVAGTLALAVLLAHVIEGQFDVFWVSPIGSMPWIIVGMGMAAANFPRGGDAEPVGGAAPPERSVPVASGGSQASESSDER
jgi:hypothetical protein